MICPKEIDLKYLLPVTKYALVPEFGKLKRSSNPKCSSEMKNINSYASFFACYLLKQMDNILLNMVQAIEVFVIK